MALFFALAMMGATYAQQNTVVAGADYTGVGGSVSLSIGQIDYFHFTDTGGSTNEGNQQPLEFFNVGIEEHSLFDIQLFPNPVAALLTVKMAAEEIRDVYCELVDLSGKKLMEIKVKEAEFTLDLTAFSRANYRLNFIQNGAIIGSYQINKN